MSFSLCKKTSFLFNMFEECIGLIFSKYFSDERILEYDIDEVLFDQRSPFQKVQIVHSKSLGNMLVLDELQSKKTIIKLENIYYDVKFIF